MSSTATTRTETANRSTKTNGSITNQTTSPKNKCHNGIPTAPIKKENSISNSIINCMNEDDPDTLLNEWLGELENLIGVSLMTINFGVSELILQK